MFKLSEAAQWDDQQCAKYIAQEAADLWEEPSEAGLDVAILTAVNDVWLDAAGNLHRFAERARKGEDRALNMIRGARYLDRGPTLLESLGDI